MVDGAGSAVCNCVSISSRSADRTHLLSIGIPDALSAGNIAGQRNLHTVCECMPSN